jgi:hypothetical protein
LQHGCTHLAWVQRSIGIDPCTEVIDPVVRLSNDNDGSYIQTFHSRAELDAFIDMLRAAGDETWPPAPSAHVLMLRATTDPKRVRFAGDGSVSLGESSPAVPQGGPVK